MKIAKFMAISGLLIGAAAAHPTCSQWQDFSTNDRVVYAAGIVSGLDIAVFRAKLDGLKTDGMSDFLQEVTSDRLADGITGICEKPENLRIQMPFPAMAFGFKLNGMKSQEVEDFLAAIRRIAAQPVSPAPHGQMQ